MSELFKNTNRRIPISKDDIKKAVLTANVRFKAENSKLEKDIKALKQEIKQHETENKVLIKTSEELENNIELAKFNLASINGKIAGSRMKLSDADTAVESQNKEFKTLKQSCDALGKKEVSLEKSIAGLQERKSTFTIKVKDLKELDSKIDKSAKNLSSMAKDIEKLEEEIGSLEVMKKEVEIEFDSNKEVLDQRNAFVESSLNVMEVALKKAEKEHDESLANLEVDKKEMRTDVEVLESMIKKKEIEYSVIEGNLETINNRVNVAEANIKRAEDNQKAAVNRVKMDFEKWKLSALEQVAKMKLKGKIDTIDKAGLSGILNG